MADELKGYQTSTVSPTDGEKLVTVTPVTGNKVALDVAVKGGSVSTTPGDAPSDDPLTGDSLHDNGTVGLVAVPVPAIAGGVITIVLIECPADQDITNLLQVSFDGGINFKSLSVSSHMAWTPRGGITQIYIKGNAAAVKYEILMNRNP